MSYLLSAIYSSSQYGLTAAEYACGLADILKCPVRLVHSYVLPISISEIPLPVMAAEDVRSVAAVYMDESVIKLRNRWPDIDITGDIAYGDLADVLDEISQAKKPLLTIIGNDEENDADVWIGSNTGAMLREGDNPVLAVPYTAIFQQPAHVCIASDGQSIAEGASVDVLLQLKEAMNFGITVLHVKTEGGPVITFPESTLGIQLNAANVKYVEISAPGTVNDAITAYTTAHGVDWLAVIPHHYTFWQGLFHKSHTSQMLHMAHMPVLALH